MNWNQTLVDGEELTHDIDCIKLNGVIYNIEIQLKKYEKEVNKMFGELLRLKNHSNKKNLKLDVNSKGKLSGKRARWVLGSNPALHYRGNELKRHKVWFQENPDGVYLYKYTGWQKVVSNATFRIGKKRFPETKALVKLMKRKCKQNHWIVTRYENGDDYIGMHSDKTKTWRKDSKFQVIKWGHARIFRITLIDHEEVDKCTVLFEKILPAGTSIVVDMKTNEITRHGVPIMKGNVGISGSIVGRDIKTFVTFKEIKKMCEQAKKDKLKRQQLKQLKRAKALKNN